MHSIYLITITSLVNAIWFGFVTSISFDVLSSHSNIIHPSFRPCESIYHYVNTDKRINLNAIHGKLYCRFLSPRFFKKAKGILLSPPSVRPLCYLLLNHWTKFNQIWCVSYSHKWGAQRKIFFGPRPWGPREGPKGQISFNFKYKVIFKDFYSKLCVCSHK